MAAVKPPRLFGPGIAASDTPLKLLKMYRLPSVLRDALLRRGISRLISAVPPGPESRFEVALGCDLGTITRTSCTI